MILDIEEQRLLVISDLHLGSPASSAATRLPRFLDEVGRDRTALCINGDGFDLLQSSQATFARSMEPVVKQLNELMADGIRVYYTVGNHDLALEHMLHDLPLTVAPFFNLRSGSSRIRIEHGHIYEPAYAKHPRLYHFGGRCGRFFLLRSADWYKVWSTTQLIVDRRRRQTIDGKSIYPHHLASETILQRGFDATVFGHTHLPERTDIGAGLFVNSGSWMKGADVVVIENGDVSLESWSP